MKLIDLENLSVDVDGCWRMQTPLTQDMWAMLSRLVDAEIERVRTQPCKWCRDDGQVVLEVPPEPEYEAHAHLYTGEAYLSVDDDGACLYYDAPTGERGWGLVINYCPGCGRKLDDE